MRSFSGRVAKTANATKEGFMVRHKYLEDCMMLGNARQVTVCYKAMLMPVVGLLVSAAIGFPLNPSFTPEAVKEYKVKADLGDAEAQYLYSSALANGKGVSRDLPQALVYAKKAADQGYERALRRVGLGYERGWGVESNSVKAAECYSRFVAWATKAAEQGDANAQHSLGHCYFSGNGVEKDAKEAAKWYRKAAEQGIARAQFDLGCCHDHGLGVEKDAKEAVKWYRKAAEQGLARAQHNLGCSYDHGDGVEKDAKEAAKWWRKAAEQGIACAQCNLGACYWNGYGVEKNANEAMKWWRKAAEQGYLREHVMAMVRGCSCFVLVFALLVAWWTWRKGAALRVYWLNSWRRCLDFYGRSSKQEYIQGYVIVVYSILFSCLAFSSVCLGGAVWLAMHLYEFYPFSLWVDFNSDSFLIICACLGGCFGFPFLVPFFALDIRRLHDVGKSGWCEMLWLVPVWGWIRVWCLLMRDGDPARNKYGDPPPMPQPQPPTSAIGI